MLDYIDLILTVVGAFLDKLRNKVPAEIFAAFEAGYKALEAHKQDLMTKADWEANRG